MRSAEALPANRWADLPERGTPALVRLIVWIAVHIGRWAARLLLYPVTLYFLITAHTARRVSYEYLKRIRDRPVSWWHVFRHFHCFAATILDRVYLLKGEFETAHNENITRFLDALNEEIASTVIVPDRPDTLLRVKESLDAGFLVGMLGDRVSSGGKTTQCQFLGAPATFPAGPILLAAMMRCPIILFFGLYRGGSRYEIYFEDFAQGIILNRDHRAEEIQHWMQRYVERLEYYARLAPYNWFNFYAFWD